MAQTPRPIPVNLAGKRARPVQDVATVKRQGNQFPAVGMTLRSYQYDPSDRHKRTEGVRITGSRWQNFKRKITLKRAVIGLGIIVLLIGAFLAFKFIYNAQKVFGGNIFDALKSTKLKGEDVGRVNILLAGNSADDVGHDGGELTDSVMIISIDTKQNKAFLLSVPRDLWVPIPDNGHQKINAAYPAGENDEFEAEGYPKGGMGLLQQVVEDNLGVDINYYALVNYNALRKAVDAVGGVDYTVKSDDKRGLYDPNIDYKTKKPLVKLSNGTHHLNGQQALNLSRARGDAYNSYGFPSGDFNRSENQRQLLVALKTKVASSSTLANPAKISSLTDAIGGNVRTDFNLSELRRLNEVTKPISGNNIRSLSLNDADGVNLLASYNARGQSALIPAAGLDDFSDIQAFLKRQTSSNPVVQEAAKVVILNGTETSGLASKKRTTLEEKDVNVTDVGGSTAPAAATQIIDNSLGKKAATRQLLVKTFGNSVTTTNPYVTMYPEADFIIVLGPDQVPKPTNQ